MTPLPRSPGTPGDLRAWLAGTFLPAWAGRAFEPARPGFLEWLDAEGRPDWDRPRTTLNTARLVYAFSHGHLLGGGDAMLAAAGHGLDFLLGRCRNVGGLFHHAVAADGTVLDARVDLYDLAFVLFALGWHARATGSRESLDTADRVMRLVEARMAEETGGFAEDDARSLPRRQNPHMHLLEACHALAEAGGGDSWLDRASRLVRLLGDRLVDRETGTLREFFAADWGASPGERDRVREPGHHFEWVWLLHHHARLTGRDEAPGVADGLYDFALRHGIATLPDGDAMVLDEVDPSGEPITPTGLLWPQTEALKAFGARAEFTGDRDAATRAGAQRDAIFRHYLDAGTGLWHNRLAPDGRPIRAECPVRVLYHVVLALAETARLDRAGVLPALPGKGLTEHAAI